MAESTEEEKKEMFLKGIGKVEKSVGDVMEDAGVNAEDVGRWRREDEKFAERLKDVKRGMRIRREWDLSRGAAGSATRMVRVASGNLKEVTERQRKSWVDLIKLERSKEGRRRGDEGPDARSLVPPSVMREAERVFQDLKREREKTDRLLAEEGRRLHPLASVGREIVFEEEER